MASIFWDFRGLLLMSARQPHKVSSRDLNLLRGHIGAICALSQGLRQPESEAQERFVRVARGELLAETEMEKAFLSFLKLTIEQQEKFIESYRDKIEHKIDRPVKKAASSRRNKINKHSKTEKKKVTKKNKRSKTEKQNYIEDMHRISGYNRITARFVRG